MSEAVEGVVEVSTWSCLPDLLASGVCPDAVVLDVRLNDGSTAEGNVASCCDQGWPVLLYTMETNAAVVRRCFRAGASGLVGKHEELAVLGLGVERVLNGEAHLSPTWARALDAAEDIPELSAREKEALTWYAKGLPLKSVARRMGVTAETAKAYLLRVRRKYAEAGRPAGTKTELTVRALEDGYLPTPLGPRIVETESSGPSSAPTTMVRRHGRPAEVRRAPL